MGALRRFLVWSTGCVMSEAARDGDQNFLLSFLLMPPDGARAETRRLHAGIAIDQATIQ